MNRCQHCGRVIEYHLAWVAEDGESECVMAPADVEVHEP